MSGAATATALAAAPVQDKWAAIRDAASRSPHGTNARYSSGCRCEPCRLARSQYLSDTKWRLSRGHGRSVSTERARRHILELSRRGMGYLAVAEAASVNHGIVWGIRQGVRKRARWATVERILRVDLSCARAGTRVPAGPTWRILNELIDRGFSKRQIAIWMGFRGKGSSLQLRHDLVTAENAARVRKVKSLLDAGKLRRGDPGPLPRARARNKRGSLPGRRRSDAPRCPCGRMTLKCAKARSHHCGEERNG